MVLMAFLSLIFGAMAGKNAASASSGLSANLREAIYANIQTFSFSNIDKFSVPGLVTRMTTDITNVQNAFMMVIRVACLLYTSSLGNIAATAGIGDFLDYLIFFHFIPTSVLSIISMRPETKNDTCIYIVLLKV